MKKTFLESYRLILAPIIYTELQRTLTTEGYFLKKLSNEDVTQYIEALRDIALTIRPQVEVRGVATHPEDDRILEVALSAHADYLVSSDKHLQALRTYDSVTILSPAQFLSTLLINDAEAAIEVI